MTTVQRVSRREQRTEGGGFQKTCPQRKKKHKTDRPLKDSEYTERLIVLSREFRWLISSR